jgi:hypothetical protein
MAVAMEDDIAFLFLINKIRESKYDEVEKFLQNQDQFKTPSQRQEFIANMQSCATALEKMKGRGSSWVQKAKKKHQEAVDEQLKKALEKANAYPVNDSDDDSDTRGGDDGNGEIKRDRDDGHDVGGGADFGGGDSDGDGNNGHPVVHDSDEDIPAPTAAAAPEPPRQVLWVQTLYNIIKTFNFSNEYNIDGIIKHVFEDLPREDLRAVLPFILPIIIQVLFYMYFWFNTLDSSYITSSEAIGSSELTPLIVKNLKKIDKIIKAVSYVFKKNTTAGGRLTRNRNVTISDATKTQLNNILRGPLGCLNPISIVTFGKRLNPDIISTIQSSQMPFLNLEPVEKIDSYFRLAVQNKIQATQPPALRFGGTGYESKTKVYQKQASNDEILHELWEDLDLD